MIILLNKDLTYSYLEEFVQEINSVEDKDDITIYISSNGGASALVPLFKNIIEKYQIRLISYGIVASAGLDLFLTTNTPRSVLDESTGMFHRTILGGMDLDMNFKSVEDERLIEIWKTPIVAAELTAKFLKLTQKQLDQVRDGKELYFNHIELKNALEESEKFFTKNLEN